MKSFVWKKRFFALIGDVIFLDVIFISLIIFFILQEVSFKVSFLFSTILIILNILSFMLMRFEGSIISFEKNEIKCIFLKRVRRVMSYNEIQDYGVFSCGTIFQGKESFIYISRFKLTEEQRKMEAYRLYRKTKNVLALKYYEEALSYLRNKCPNIIPYIDTAS